MAPPTGAFVTLILCPLAGASSHAGQFANTVHCKCLVAHEDSGELKTEDCTPLQGGLYNQKFYYNNKMELNAGFHGDDQVCVVAGGAVGDRAKLELCNGADDDSIIRWTGGTNVSMLQRGSLLHPSGLQLKRTDEDYLVLAHADGLDQSQIFEFHCHLCPNPHWTCDPLPMPVNASVLKSGYHLVAPEECLTLPHGNTSNGNHLEAGQCHDVWFSRYDDTSYGDGLNQLWSFQDGQLKYAADPSKCVVLFGHPSNGSQPVLWDCHSEADGIYRWGYDPDSSAFYLGGGAASEKVKCLQHAVPDCRPHQGCRQFPLEVWDCNGETKQQWWIEAPPSSEPHLMV